MALGSTAGAGPRQWVPEMFQLVAAMKPARASPVVAVFIGVMTCPKMVQVDFASIQHVGLRPLGLLLTLVVSGLIMPFSMAGLAGLFFEHLFTP